MDRYGRVTAAEAARGFDNLARMMKRAMPPTGPHPYKKVTGHVTEGRFLHRVVTGYDDEMFAEIDRVAREMNVCFSEAVRTIIQWGLDAKETEDEEDQATG